ncbi:MAG TPA: DUF4350 domain-containing protein [Thermoanaerobaculia bacterium]
MSRSTIGWIVLALVFAGLVVAGFLSLFERVEEERDVGYRGEALANELLAFERLVGELGVPAGHPRDPLALPPPDHALLALGAHHPPGPAYLDKLLAWVEAGGHLVFVPAGDDAGRSIDPLLERVEVTLEWPQREDGGEEDGEEDGKEDVAKEPGNGGEDDGEDGEDADPDEAFVRRYPPVPLAAREDAPMRRVGMPEWPRLHDDSGVHLSGRPDGASLVAFSWGEGRVTVLADASFLDNRHLGRLDHARFAWDLVTAGGQPAGLTIADWRRAVPLFALVARRGWPLAAAGLLLVAAWIAHRGARFGPPLPDEPPPRRSLLEHVRASGAFLWRRGQSDELLAASRAALARRVDLVHAEWARQSEGERVRHLARLSRLPAGTVAAALAGEAPDAADFTRTVATLERLRRSL